MSKSHLIVVGVAGALVILLFAPALSGRWSFAFRDAAHFYHPLFEFIRSEWGAGRLPLWNPYENIGMPLAGETTSSVFYPGKLLFALPLGYTRLYNAYIVGHVVLAGLTSFSAARHFGASVLAAGLAALAYTFGGSVLFQYCNVVFLVGAAWLPLAVLLIDRTLRGRSWRAAVGLGVVLALMITGGDPQMAYNSGLMAVLYAVILWRARRRWARAEIPDAAGTLTPCIDRAGSSIMARAPALLTLSAVTCCSLAAVQILPAREATRRSVRAAYDSPRSVYELAATVASRGVAGENHPIAWHAGLLGTAARGHQRHLYQFNVGPWRIIEFVWPNISGRQFPTHRRWLDALPAEGRVWTPSLYMGLLPVILAVSSFSVCRTAPVEVRWFSWIVLWSAAASMGVYGLVWAAREVAGWFGASLAGAVGDEVGGAYWLTTVLAPGYVYFRYPAKLLVITGMGMSLLAARGWDDTWRCPTARLRRCLCGLSVGSAIVLVLVLVVWSSIAARLATMPPDRLFGPFDTDGAWRDVVGGLVQTAVISAVLLALAVRPVRARVGPYAVAVGLVITAVDLAIAQSWLVSYAPASAWGGPPQAVTAIREGIDNCRVYRDRRWQPQSWRTSSSVDRLHEALLWDRGTLAPKHALAFHVPVVEASSTMAPLDYRVLLEVARRPRDAGDWDERPHGSVLNLLAARVALLSSRDGAITQGDRPLDGNDMATVRRLTALPRAWIVHEVEVLPRLRSRAPWQVKRRTEAVLFPDGRPRDWSTSAVVETDEALPVAPQTASPLADEACRIVVAEPRHVEIEVALASPGLVVLSDAYDPGWTLTVETDGATRNAPMLRTNRVMRGVALPAGDYRLVYQYRPASVRWGATISGLSVLAMVILSAITAMRRRRRV